MEDFSTLSSEELIARIQELGAQIDALKATRKALTAEYDRQANAKEIRLKYGGELSDSQVEQISAIIFAEVITSKTEAK